MAQRLGAEHEVQRYEIDPDASDGIVTLRGQVDDRTQRTTAERIVRDTAGVSDVHNQLMLSEDHSRDHVKRAVDNAMVESRLGAELVADPMLRPARIVVDAEQGVVTLTGTVDRDEMKRRAGDIARVSEGVRRVDNRLRIAGTR